MADDKAKKTKIDLKARLGKTTQMGLAPPPGAIPTAPGATPPPPASDPGAPVSAPSSSPSAVPSAPGSRPSAVPAPVGIAPPPNLGLTPGIMPPGFGPRPAPKAPDPKPSAAQQTIKVEIGEEIHEERKKYRKFIALGALGGALVGLFIGFTAGGSSEKGDRAKSAARGAGLLEKDVKAANEKLKELDAKLGEASEKLKGKNFPEDLSTSLAGLTIPFDDINLEGKGVNGMPSRLFKLVNDYTQSCKGLNKSRESLKNLASLAKDPMTKAWKEESAPVANFSVIFRTESNKVVADLVPNPSPFAWKGDFPEKYKVNKPEGARAAEKEAKRYVKGDLPGNDLTAIPIDPKTTAAFSSEVMIGRFSKALYDIRQELQGNKENPTNETPGLLKMGDDLVVELHKASLNQ